MPEPLWWLSSFLCPTLPSYLELHSSTEISTLGCSTEHTISTCYYLFSRYWTPSVNLYLPFWYDFYTISFGIMQSAHQSHTSLLIIYKTSFWWTPKNVIWPEKHWFCWISGCKIPSFWGMTACTRETCSWHDWWAIYWGDARKEQYTWR